MVLILEDDDGRVRRFKAVLESLGVTAAVRVWRNGHHFAHDLSQWIADATLISLDHDLLPDDRLDEDWGDGYQAAKAVAEFSPVCPVLVHTTNAERGRWMMGALDLGGWDATRVYPLGEGWIEDDWRYYVSKVLGLG